MSANPLEQRIQEMLQYRLDQYRRLNELADLMLGEGLSPEQSRDTSEQMRQISLRLEAAESQQQSLTEEYRQSGVRPASVLSAIKQELAQLMQNFLMKVSRLEQNALKSKEALLPQIHAGVRAVQMKNAYGKYV